MVMLWCVNVYFDKEFFVKYELELHNDTPTGAKVVKFEAGWSAHLWMTVGETLLKEARKGDVSMGILYLTNEQGEGLRKVCGNDTISAGFNVLLYEILRLRKKLNKRQKNQTTKRR